MYQQQTDGIFIDLKRKKEKKQQQQQQSVVVIIKYYILNKHTYIKMKWSPPGPHFGEQVNDLTRIFLGWNTCEQTIVLYALMRKIPTAQAKFLSRTIQHHLESLTDLNNLETNANNPGTYLDFYFFIIIILPFILFSFFLFQYL